VHLLVDLLGGLLFFLRHEKKGYVKITINVCLVIANVLFLHVSCIGSFLVFAMRVMYMKDRKKKLQRRSTYMYVYYMYQWYTFDIDHSNDRRIKW
jgi:hypothetical protein